VIFVATYVGELCMFTVSGNWKARFLSQSLFLVDVEFVWLKVIGCSSLRGGGGELGKLKSSPMAPTKLQNIKLKYAIYMCNYVFF